MSDNFNEEINITPSLSFDAAFEDINEVKKVEEERPKETNEEDILTVEEKKMVDDFVEKIDLTNSNSILQYGVGAQKKIADFSETALNNVKTKDLGAIGDFIRITCFLFH